MGRWAPVCCGMPVHCVQTRTTPHTNSSSVGAAARCVFGFHPQERGLGFAAVRNKIPRGIYMYAPTTYPKTPVLHCQQLRIMRGRVCAAASLAARVASLMPERIGQLHRPVARTAASDCLVVTSPGTRQWTTCSSPPTKYTASRRAASAARCASPSAAAWYVQANRYANRPPLTMQSLN